MNNLQIWIHRSYFDILQLSYFWGLFIDDPHHLRLRTEEEVDLDEPLTQTRRNVIREMMSWLKDGAQLLVDMGPPPAQSTSRADFVNAVLESYHRNPAVLPGITELTNRIRGNISFPPEVVVGMAAIQVWHNLHESSPVTASVATS